MVCDEFVKESIKKICKRAQFVLLLSIIQKSQKIKDLLWKLL